MSFTPSFAPDAKAQWGAMDFEIQELVLDEMDRLSLTPPGPGEHISDLVFEKNGQRHYIFVRVRVDHRYATVTIIGVGHFARAV